MTHSGKRAAAPFRDLVKESSGLGTVREQLERVEQLLGLRLDQVRKPTAMGRVPKDTVIADLDLSSSDYEYIISLLSQQLQSVEQTNKGYSRIFDKFSLAILVSLVGIEATREDDSFWDAYYEAIQPKHRELLEAKVRESLEKLLSKKMLTTFSRFDLGYSRYVLIIAFHAVLSKSTIDLIVDDLRAFDSRANKTSDPIDIEDFAQRAKTRLRQKYENGEGEAILQRLTTVFDKRSVEFLSRIAELYALVEQHHGWPDIEFEDNHGLPETAFTYLKSQLAAPYSEKKVLPDKAESEQNCTKQLPPSLAPFLKFDVEESAFLMVIPGGSAIAEDGIEWTITIDGVSSTHVQPYDWSTGKAQSLEVVVSSPSKSLQAVSEFGSFTFDVAEACERGLFLVGRSGRILTNQRAFGGGTAYLLRAAHTKLTPHGPAYSRFSLNEFGPVAGWTGWSSFEVSLSEITRITLSRPANNVEKSWEIVQRGGGDPDWRDGEFYKELRGPDGAVVYKTSPQLLLPEDSSEWSIRCLATAKDGTLWAIDGTWDVNSRERFFKVFEDADDPWIGHFQINLYRDGLLFETRRYNIIEGLECDISFEGGFKSPFTAPVQISKRNSTRAFVSFESLNSYVRCPHGSKAISNQVGQKSNESFEIASSADPDLYHISVSVVAPALTYLIPLRQERLRWAGHFSTVDVNQLDPAGDIKVKFPTTVHNPRFVFIKTARNSNSPMDAQSIKHFDLNKAHTNRSQGSKMWSLNVSNLLEAMSDGYNYRLALEWFPTSDREYVNNLASNFERKQAFRAIAAGNLVREDRDYAALCDIALKPLLDKCEIDGSTLIVHVGRPILWELACKVWPISSPLSGAHEIELKPQNGTYQGRLPEELVGVGALAVEVKDMSIFDVWGSEYPTSASRVADQSNVDLVDNPAVLHPWMYLGNGRMELTHPEIQEVWNARYALTGPLATSSNRSVGLLRAFDTTTLAFLGAHPRTALGQLDKSIIPKNLQVEAFIRSGIVYESFASSTTYGTIHPVPWVGLLQELNDVKTLEKDVFSDQETIAEKAESLDYIRDTGNFLLPEWLSGSLLFVENAVKLPVPLSEVRDWKLEEIERYRTADGSGLLSAEERMAGLAELAAHRADVIKMDRVRKTVQILGNKVHLLRYLGEREILHAVRDLEFEAEKCFRSQKDLWTWAPYISASCALLARMQAHGLIHADNELNYIKNTWAQIARYAPRLAAYDLVCAEAITLGKTN